jgi:hypothetical protein
MVVSHFQDTCEIRIQYPRGISPRLHLDVCVVLGLNFDTSWAAHMVFMIWKENGQIYPVDGTA